MHSAMKYIVAFLILSSTLFVSHAQKTSHALSLHFGALFFMPPQWNDITVNRMTYSLSIHKFSVKASAYALGGGGLNVIRSYSLFKTARHRSPETISGYRYTRMYLGGDMRVGYKLNKSMKHLFFVEGIVSYRKGHETETIYVNPSPPYDGETLGHSVKQWGVGLGLSHRWHFTPSRRFFITEDIAVQKVFKSQANVIVEVGLGMRLNKTRQ
jgi:hypothetical protein